MVSVRDLHVWALKPGMPLLATHLNIDGARPVACMRAAERLKAALTAPLLQCTQYSSSCKILQSRMYASPEGGWSRCKLHSFFQDGNRHACRVPGTC